MQKYNIYLDESSIDNPKNNFMVIGGLFIKRELRDELKGKLKDIRKKYDFSPELKWTKINTKILPFTKEIIDMFFEYSGDDVQFHCIVVEKSSVLYDIHHAGDKELAFYKFIYQLLQNKFKNNSQYYLFLDHKQNKDADRLKELGKFLKIVINKKCDKTELKHLQSYCSKEMQLIQLTDLFIGAVGYQKNNFSSSESKKELISYIANKLGKEDLDFKSPRNEKKFNIFKINL